MTARWHHVTSSLTIQLWRQEKLPVANRPFDFSNRIPMDPKSRTDKVEDMAGLFPPTSVRVGPAFVPTKGKGESSCD